MDRYALFTISFIDEQVAVIREKDKQIESLRQELDEEIMLRITLQKMNQKLVDDKKAWKSLNKYTEEE